MEVWGVCASCKGSNSCGNARADAHSNDNTTSRKCLLCRLNNSSYYDYY